MAEMQSTINSFLWPNKYMLNVLGFWPTESNDTNTSRFFTHFRIVFSIFLVSTLFIPQMITVILYWNDISVLAGLGSIGLEIGQLIFKFFYMIIYRQQFSHVYQKAKKFWLITENKKEQETLEQLAELSKQITIVFFLTGISNVITFVSASISMWIKNNRIQQNGTSYSYLPLDIRYGIDTQHSPNYQVAVCCQTIAMIYCALGVIGFDATMLTLILHICGQFRLICLRLRDLNGSDDDGAFKKQFKKKIKKCLAHHQQIIRIAKETRLLLSPVIFVQLMSSGVEICLCGYVLVLGDENSPADLVKYGVYTLTMFLQLLVWCWPGELLVQDSTAIESVVCHEVPWYLLPAEQQRDLGLLVLRAQKECHVTALSFQVMSMSKLTEIFNTAASYFALLRSISNK